MSHLHQGRPLAMRQEESWVYRWGWSESGSVEKELERDVVVLT